MPTASIILNTTETHTSLIIHPPLGGMSVQGVIEVPGDKSMSHRSLMLGALARGETQIKGLLLGDDPHSTAACLRAMGAQISDLNSENVTVQGIGVGALKEPTDVLNMGNSGTTMRLMLGILASHPDRFVVATGDASLRSRPMARVIRPLEQMGATIWSRTGGYAPLAVQGRQLTPIHYHSPIASAQVKSCVLLAGLMAEGATTVTEPAPSRDHSERMLGAFGATVAVDPEAHCATIHGPATLAGQHVVVPGDISSAAFWLVAGAIIPGADLTIKNVGINPTRTGILEVLQAMEADVSLLNTRTITGEPVADLRIRHSPLKGCSIQGDIIPRLIDEIPVLAVAASFATGRTVIQDAAELRVKESDRITVMANQLNRMGAHITERPDGMEIEGNALLTGVDVDSYADHRIAMSLAIAALCAQGTTTIHRAEAAAISYPDFVPTLQSICTK